MSTVPIICVDDVEKTSLLLQGLLDWKSSHGGSEFDDLVDKKGRSVLWLHDPNAHDHPRFQGADTQKRGVGMSIYVLVDDVDKTYDRVKRSGLDIIEPLAMNENAGFREFTFRIEDGYAFSVCEQGEWLKI